MSSTTVATSSDKTSRTVTRAGDVGVITYEPLDASAIEQSVRSTKAGAVVTFVGYTRDEFQGRQVTHLDYESYTPLAIKTLHSVLEKVRTLPRPLPLQHPADDAHDDMTSHSCCPPSRTDHAQNESQFIELVRCEAWHLLGESPPMTPSIVICVSAPHRRDAFVACEWLLEEVKRKVQVWKREWYADGTTFRGQDGHGPDDDQHRNKSSAWKENFPVA
ncbi:hypothetical protein ACM66B_007122 [Microbotryomycetes sp. NB124-2]